MSETATPGGALDAPHAPHEVAGFLLLAVLSAALVAPSWDAPFSGRDDNRFVVNNPVVKGEKTVYEALFYNELELYQPAVLLAHRFERQMLTDVFKVRDEHLFAYWAPFSRIMGGLFHLLAGLALWHGVLPKLNVRGAAALLVTAIFLVHPLQCENLCWIAERKSILAGFFMACTLALYLQARLREPAAPAPGGPSGDLPWDGVALASWLGVGVLYALALASKISAAGLIPLLAAWEMLLGPQRLFGSDLRARLHEPREFLGRMARIALPLGLLVLLSLPFLRENWHAAEKGLGFRLGGSWFGTLLGDVEIVARYLLLAACPWNLSTYYAVVAPASPFDAAFLGYAALLAGALGVSLWLPASEERRRFACFGWAWFFGAMVTYLNLVPNSEYMHDRYLYFSLPGLGLVLVECARGLHARLGGRVAARTGWFAALGLAVLWAALGARTAGFWQSDIHVFRRAAEAQPDCSFAHGYLGLSLGVIANQRASLGKPEDLEQARVWREEALAALRRAGECPDIETNLRRVQYMVAQAVILKAMGRMDEVRRQIDFLQAETLRRGWTTPRDLDFARYSRLLLEPPAPPPPPEE
ncbi:MAG: hypothetical protein HS116_26545 [Planctomycetes bacterium]|nr:hypothetical protein [Planctomycetota bacterium]